MALNPRSGLDALLPGRLRLLGSLKPDRLDGLVSGGVWWGDPAWDSAGAFCMFNAPRESNNSESAQEIVGRSGTNTSFDSGADEDASGLMVS